MTVKYYLPYNKKFMKFENAGLNNDILEPTLYKNYFITSANEGPILY